VGGQHVLVTAPQSMSPSTTGGWVGVGVGTVTQPPAAASRTNPSAQAHVLTAPTTSTQTSLAPAQKVPEQTTSTHACLSAEATDPEGHAVHS